MVLNLASDLKVQEEYCGDHGHSQRLQSYFFFESHRHPWAVDRHDHHKDPAIGFALTEVEDQVTMV